jgi:hypothetical protein
LTSCGRGKDAVAAGRDTDMLDCPWAIYAFNVVPKQGSELKLYCITIKITRVFISKYFLQVKILSN